VDGSATVTPRAFRFAVQAMELSDADAVRGAAHEAEQLGYVQFFSFDHIGAVDPFVPLMVAAGAAPGLHVGPLVLNNELHHPALLARTAATVDLLTGGRLVLGLGTGYMSAEHDAIGSSLREPGPRVRRFAESIAVLRALLDDGVARVDGEFHHVAIDDLGVRPAQPHVPFLIGGHGHEVVRLAAKHADIFQFTGLTHGPDGTPGPGGFGLADVRARAHWLADAAGDRLDAIERSALVQRVHVGAGADEHVAALADRLEVSRDLIVETPFVLAGSVEQVVDKVERLRAELGISHFVVRDAAGFAPVVAVLAGR
jgi:probable F420-dependent oxidoreductase